MERLNAKEKPPLIVKVSEEEAKHIRQWFVDTLDSRLVHPITELWDIFDSYLDD